VRSRAVARRYGYAIHEMAMKSGSVDRLLEQMGLLRKTVEKVPMFIKTLGDDRIKQETRFNILTEISRYLELDSMLKNLLMLLVAKKRICLLPWIIDDVTAMAMRQMDLTRVEIIVAENEIAGEVKIRVERILKNAPHMNAICEVEVDESILGGFLVHIGDRVFDASIRGRLNQMKEKLLHAGSLITRDEGRGTRDEKAEIFRPSS